MTLRTRPPWLDEVVFESIADARRLPWGFTNESWLVTAVRWSTDRRHPIP